MIKIVENRSPLRLENEFCFQHFQTSGSFLNQFFLSLNVCVHHFRFKEIKNNNRTAIQFRIDYVI